MYLRSNKLRDGASKQKFGVLCRGLIAGYGERQQKRCHFLPKKGIEHIYKMNLSANNEGIFYCDGTGQEWILDALPPSVPRDFLDRGFLRQCRLGKLQAPTLNFRELPV